jgi:hypothetical protein
MVLDYLGFEIAPTDFPDHSESGAGPQVLRDALTRNPDKSIRRSEPIAE